MRLQRASARDDFIRSCENALHFFGGAPQALVTDNLKSVVTKASRYEAVLNEDLAALVASHQRDRTPHGYTTAPEHQPALHRYVIEWTPENFLSQARAIDQDVEYYVSKILEGRGHPEQAHKCCAGIMALARKVGHECIVSACRFATSLNAYGYTTLEDILNRRLDQLEAQCEDECEIPEHDNIRGKEYYK